uniref:Uncharacterized protein n=1 Tax=Tanacetum cinerariifolium TaxID=118510 RepID=A0A6L2JU51_TANCI|nr:hypothetical protein [Tanacetum cinerariifolium]
MSAQSEGNYAEALQNYYEAMRLEIDPYDRAANGGIPAYENIAMGKIDSLFQQTSSLKPYVSNVILEKIIIDLEDEVVNLLEKEKANLETIESLKSKGFESSENVISELENQSENDCLVVEKECDKEENPKMIAPGMFKLNVMNDLLDDNNFFIFDDVNVRISPVSKMPFRKKPRDSMHVRSKNFLDLSLDHRFGMFKAYDGVGQFCDKGLEVAFQKSTCFVQNEDGVDLLTGDRSSNLYTIALNEVASNSSTCLSKMKFEKDHLCSACEQGKIHRKHHKSKMAFASNKPLYLLHMDLCGSMRVQSINGKQYVLVVVDDYSRTPQQNGVVERRNRTLVEAARSMLTFANLLLEPGLSNLNETGKSLNLSVSQVDEASKKDLEDLFQDFYDEYFDSSKIMKSSTTNVENPINEEVFHEVSESFQGESSSSSLNDVVQQSLEEVILPQTNTQSISNNMVPNGDKASTSHSVFNERLEDAYFDASTSFHDSSNVHTYYQPYPHEKKWTKDHPLHKLIGDPKSSV